METRPLHYFATACGGELRSGSPATPVRRVQTDSRQAAPGDLFVALKGERFDAHDFLGEVAAKDVAGVVVARAQLAKLPAGLPAIVVEDPRTAYGAIAGFYRGEFELPVICVGGSNGKTTTKELLGAVLGRAFPVLKSEASFNNDIGVPATLLQLDRSHQAAVLEAGTNHPGELAPLVRLIAPRIGIVTSIGREHLEHFVDLAGVVQEEGWLPQLLPAAGQGGCLLVPGDSPFAGDLIGRTAAQVIRVGFGPANDWRAELRSMDWTGTTFSVNAPNPRWSGEYHVPLPGRHSVPNALYALAVACQLGVEPTAARDGLAEFSPAKQRLNLREAAGVRLIDDTYNANADSVAAALRTLSDLPCSGRRVAVLGDMAELGTATETAHREVGRLSAELGLDLVFAIGRNAQLTAAAAGDRARAFASFELAVEALFHCLEPGDCVLVKASRSSRLERVVEALVRQLTLRDTRPEPVPA
jgi:UDP-N-acetylmuramoyl-tripeptide--D-alanyl-D-alanine ligase